MLRFNPDTRKNKNPRVDPVLEKQLELFSERLNFSHITATKMQSAVEKIRELTTITYNSIAELADLSFETVIQPLINLDLACGAAASMATVPMDVHPDAEVREASAEACEELEKIKIEHEQRHDVYNVFEQYMATVYPFEKNTLTAEEQRYVEDMQRGYKRKGLCLESAVDRETITVIKKRLAELETQFQNNINDDDTCFEFSKADLLGLPEDWFSAERLLRDDIYKITMRDVDVNPVFDFCQNRATRATIFGAYFSRCETENLPLLLEAVQLRQRMAVLLGYNSYADYCAEIRMVKNAATAEKFILDISERLKGVQHNIIQDLTAFARDMENDPDFVLNMFDMSYYAKLREKNLFNVDHKSIQDFFPVSTVIAGTMALYQEIFGLKFVAVQTDSWHADVSFYNVLDADTNEPLGSFYLDLFTRDDKYPDAYVVSIIDGADLSKFVGKRGRRQLHTLLMVCNFSKNEGLSFEDVKTFFHEFGHLMHGICSRVQLAAFVGMNNETDFVEAPSQMLENWCFDPRVLARLSAHKVTGEPIPLEMIQNIRKSKMLHSGYGQRRQLGYANFDLALHSLSAEQLAMIDIKEFWLQIQQQSSQLPRLTECMPANLIHLMGGYESGYYGYTYSNVIAMDMFASMFQANPLSVSMGMRYRVCILEPGASKDANDLVRDFLHRDVVLEPFLELCGILPTVPLKRLTAG
jgi:Zn-dependent oligopeptidase